jgi:hypothetical protein
VTVVAADIPWADDTIGCGICGLESCEDHLPEAPRTGPTRAPRPFDESELADAVDIAAHGRTIAERGVPYVLDGVIPAYGMLGFIVAFAKVGKTTFGQALAAHLAMGRPFLDRATTACRVLVLAAEDPPEYTAWLARHLHVDRGRMTFRCASLVLTPDTLAQIAATIRAGGYGLVLIASWQAVVRGLIRDENDNAGAVRVVEDVKAAARSSAVPWLIDAHSGKGESQDDDADPSKAMRGASSHAGAADYTLSLRYSNGTFGTQRRLSGKGRFVSFAPILMDYDEPSGAYAVVGAQKDVTRETTWRLISEVGALEEGQPQSVAEIARRIGLVAPGQKLSGATRKQIQDALNQRPDVGIVEEARRGQKTKLYRRLEAL